MRWTDVPNAGRTQIRASFQATVNSTSHHVSLRISESDETAVRRIIGCLLVTLMPAEGLEEALESLKEIREFHTEAIPAPRFTPIAEHPSIKLRALPAQKAPDLVIEE